MKNRRHNIWRNVLLGTGLVLLILSFSSCEPEGMSIDDRIDAFLDDAESGKDLGEHFSDVTQSGIAADTFSSGVLDPATGGFSWVETGRTSDSRTGNIIRGNGNDYTGVVFIMKKETLTGLLGGEDWKIFTVEIDAQLYPNI